MDLILPPQPSLALRSKIHLSESVRSNDSFQQTEIQMRFTNALDFTRSSNFTESGRSNRSKEPIRRTIHRRIISTTVVQSVRLERCFTAPSLQ